MVFNATFKNISVISLQSVLLVEETGVPGENHRPATVINHRQKLCHVYQVDLHLHRSKNINELQQMRVQICM